MSLTTEKNVGLIVISCFSLLIALGKDNGLIIKLNLLNNIIHALVGQ